MREARFAGASTKSPSMLMKAGAGEKIIWWRSGRINEKRTCLRSDVKAFKLSNSLLLLLNLNTRSILIINFTRSVVFIVMYVCSLMLMNDDFCII